MTRKHVVQSRSMDLKTWVVIQMYHHPNLRKIGAKSMAVQQGYIKLKHRVISGAAGKTLDNIDRKIK